MKIKTNETNLDAKKLQQLFSLVHKVVAKYEGRLRWWKRLKVHMSYYRGMGYHCKATLGGTNIALNSGTISDTVRGGTNQAASLVLTGLTAVTKTVVA